MGLLTKLKGFSKEPYDRYQLSAHKVLEDTRNRIRQKYGQDPEVARPLEAEELKFRIRGMVEQGGLENYKHAMARWQIFRALYPEWITDADKPEFVTESWKNLPHP